MKAHLLVALGTSLPCLAQTTWIVNSAGGAQFTAIQPAIAAAAPGDRVLVQGSGPYAAFTLDKGVDVEATAGAVCATIEVVGVPAGQAARIAGFAVDQQNNGFVSVRNCGAAVLLSALARVGTSWQVNYPNPGLQVLASANVFVDRGTFVGHAGFFAEGQGILVDGASVVLVGATITGGVAVTSNSSVGNDGRPGVVVRNGGHATLRACQVEGGSSSSAFVAGGDGGDGIQVVADGSQALVLGECQLRGTPGSYGPLLSGAPGRAAVGNVRYTADTSLVGATANATMIPNRPVLAMPPTTPAGTSLVVSAQGAANQLVFVGLDLAHQYVPLPQFDGALTLTASTPLFALIVLNGAGAGTLAIAIPNVPAATNQNVFVQGLADAGGALVLTAPAVSRTL